MAITLWTAGHSNQPVSVLIEMLQAAGIEVLVDIRRFPTSRRNPQFNRDELAASLSEASIEYRHRPGLGGRRDPAQDSPNMGLRDAGFRGFADYMGTPEFEEVLTEVEAMASERRLALMCAEAVPWRCHRSLVSDALVARGYEVRHIVGGRERVHTLSPHARVREGRRVTYPALI